MDQQLIKSDSWHGRVDGHDQDSLRWHQVVQHIVTDDLPAFYNQWVLLGFCGDEGVKRNQGRAGAENGPEAIRKSASYLPVPKLGFLLPDMGNYMASNRLDVDQNVFSKVIEQIHAANSRSLVLGGGHEITYPHFLGLKKVFSDKKIGIINIDAHYDIRSVEPGIGPTSGTGFYQILSEYPETGCLILGVNEASNTQILRKRAGNCGVQELSIFDMDTMSVDDILFQIRMFAQHYDVLYLTVCMDVFSAAFAPGVSAPAALGLIPDARFFSIFREISRLNKIYAFDIAEVNPIFDIDSRTSKLAAQLLYYWLS